MPDCNRALAEFSFDDNYKFFGRLNDKDKKFAVSIQEIESLFNRIPKCDILELGLDPELVHPKHFLMGAVLVLPPCARTSVKKSIGTTQNDDLDYKYTDIVKNVAKFHEASNQKEQADAYDSISYHVRTLMDNSKSKIKNNQHKRSFKCLKKRIISKGGIIRGNIQGKRVDFCARSVITPEANGWVDELVVPEAFAKNLTYPVRVTTQNLFWCQNLLDTDKVNNIVRNGTSYSASKKLWTRGFDLHDNDIIVRRTSKEDDWGYTQATKTNYIHVWSHKQTFEKVPDLMPGDEVVRYNKVYKDLPIRQRIPFQLQEGDLIERQLMDGDWTLFNRQPTLWKGSMRAMKIKIRTGKTFRFNMACTQAYNADHDKFSVVNRRPEKVDTS